jgi:hypothetical protein
MLVWCQGFLKPPSQRCLAFPCALSKIGNKVAASPQVRQKPSSVLPNVILKSCKNSLREAVLRSAIPEGHCAACFIRRIPASPNPPYHVTPPPPLAPLSRLVQAEGWGAFGEYCLSPEGASSWGTRHSDDPRLVGNIERIISP